MTTNSTHRAGFISIIGNPNVGKSTLMNALIGKKLSIATAKAQTTRHRILGIVSGDNFQMVFSDTPGIIKPAYEIQNSMMNFVKESIVDADVLIYMVSPEDKILKDADLLEKIKQATIPLILLVNKIDTVDQSELEETVIEMEKLFPKSTIFPIAALTGFFVKELKNFLINLLPESPAYFPKEQLTDKPERFFVNEAIRKEILEHYAEEIPYAVEVLTEEFLKEQKIIRIRSVILVERNTQKGILIGHKGSALKRVGIGARKALQHFFEKKIHLELYVKVSKNWRSDGQQLKRFGYSS